MRRTARYQARGRKQQQGPGGSVSLFPFLAVLISTMGALILLLVVIARQAQLQASQVAVAEHSQRKEQLDADREMAELVVRQMTESRQVTGEQLADARLELAQIEDHARQLAKEMARLEKTASDMETLAGDGTLKREEAEAQLDRLHSLIAETKTEIEELARESHEKRSFAIVPYQGPNETFRRPVYLECTADAVILQPEGITFTVEDFQGPLGPGNPLDSALRATREYLLTSGQIPGDGSAEPYPLMLVRPDGYETYYAVRAALQSWGSDFGYELVEGDWDLAYPQPDPGLAREVGQAVSQARARQRLLVAAAPGAYGGRSERPVYRVAPHRGGVMLDDGSGRGVESAGRQPGGAGGFGGPTGMPHGGLGGDAGLTGSPRGGQDGVAGLPGMPQGGPGEAAGPAGTPPGDQQQLAGSPGQAMPEGMIAGRPPSETDGTADPRGTPTRPGEWIPPTEAQGAGPSGQEGQTGQPQHSQSSSHALAEIRGRNWGLPGAAGGSVPVTRPIRVDCHHERLVIVPETGLAGGKVISMREATKDSVDDLVGAVWELMDTWGIAGKGMYWRPVLSVRVAPGAEGRFADLQSLLRGSGLEVTRKEDVETAAAPAALTPVER